MTITPKLDAFYHRKLPIDDEEKILGIYKHHPIVYIIPLLIASAVILMLFGLAYLLVALPSADGATVVPSEYAPAIFGILALFALLILAFSYIPIWIKAQERLVLTDEAVFQLLQPSLFSDKVSQLNLQHVTDVSVRQNFWGNLFGYGSITIETPGEQANYTFEHLPAPGEIARAISNAHESYVIALESGQLKSTHRGLREAQTETPSTIDPSDYQEFLEFKRMKETIKTQQQQPANPTTGSENNPES